MFRYPKSLVRRTVGARRYRLGTRDRDLFLHPPSAEEIARQQIEKFNDAWAHALTLPFYRELAAEHSLPDVITSLDELDQWPVLTKDMLRAKEDLVWQGMDTSRSYTTSGSTSVAFSFPAGAEDFGPWYSAMWSYRSAAGLAPFERFAVFFEVHPGTLTSRWGLRVGRYRQRIKDLLNNSAMMEPLPTHDEERDEQLRTLARSRPTYLVGRTYSLLELARRARETGILREAGYAPEYMILTSERITEEDTRVVAESFDTRVMSEYGSQEIGVIAASTPDATWPMRVIWHNSLVRATSDGTALVTTLGKRAFPLINYQIGDTIEPITTGPGGTVLELGPVKGRLLDKLDLPHEGGDMHTYEGWSMVFAVMEESDVHAIQMVVHEDSVTLLVVAPGIDRDDYLERAATSIQATYPELKKGSVRLAFIDEMIPSKRGKRLLMVPEENIDTASLATVPLN